MFKDSYLIDKNFDIDEKIDIYIDLLKSNKYQYMNIRDFIMCYHNIIVNNDIRYYEIKHELIKIRPQIASLFRCKPYELCLSNYTPSSEDIFCPYKVILGNADFSKVKEEFRLNDLQVIFGNANFDNCKLKSLDRIKYIGMDASFENSNIQDLGKLDKIANTANFRNTNIDSLGNLKTVGKDLYLIKSKVRNLGELYMVFGKLILDETQLFAKQNLINNNKLIINNSKLKVVKGGVIVFNKDYTKMKKLSLKTFDNYLNYNRRLVAKAENRHYEKKMRKEIFKQKIQNSFLGKIL